MLFIFILQLFFALLLHATPVRLGTYIVTLKPETDVDSHLSSLETHATAQKFRIGSFHGYTTSLSPAQLAALSTNPGILSVEPDEPVTFQSPKIEKRVLVTQTGAPWGLGAISHLSNAPSTSYVYDSSAGQDTYAYVLSSGILTTHTAFQGQAVLGFNAVAGSSNSDASGYGTFVGGVISSVAKLATITAVKVLGDSGSTTVSSIIAGLQFTAAHINSNNRQGKSAVLLAFGGGSVSAALNNAITAVVQSGVLVFQGAGDSSAASASGPAAVVTVNIGATTPSSARATFSNYGTGVQLWAPGQNVVSAWIGSNAAYNTLSGTTHAAAYAVGLALYIQRLTFAGMATPGQVLAELAALAGSRSFGVSGVPSGSSLLVYNGAA